MIDMISITTSHMHKVLTYSILSLLILFFIGSLEFMPDLYFSWMIFALSSADILLKYKKVGNPGLLLRTHWIDFICLHLYHSYSSSR